MTGNSFSLTELLALYEISSKHSQYQSLAPELNRLVNADEFMINSSRYEAERMQYILKYLPFTSKHVLDIGGNTGYFTFEALSHGAAFVDYYEGNKDHAKFVKIAAELLGCQNQIAIFDKYYDFDNQLSENYDIVMLLNVLHHVGDDYGDKKLTIAGAKNRILSNLNNLSSKTDYLVFQLGYNWKGNKTLCLFENGLKKEMISYVSQGIEKYWDIISIGIAEMIDGKITYVDVNDSNIKRVDEYGEFLNRPLFILKSLCR